MKRRLFNVAAVVSFALAVATVVLWVVTDEYSLACIRGTRTPQGRSLRADVAGFHRGRLTWDTWLTFADIAPPVQHWVERYPGDLDGKVSLKAVFSHPSGWHALGFTWRMERDGGGWRRRMSVPLYFLGTLFAIAPIIFMIRACRRWTTKRGCCTKCGYDLRATPDRCPECGTAVAAAR